MNEYCLFIMLIDEFRVSICQNITSVIFEENMIETENIENLGHKTCHHIDFSGILADWHCQKCAFI